MTNGRTLNDACIVAEQFYATQGEMLVNDRRIGITWVDDAWECVDLDTGDSILIWYSEEDQVIFDPQWCNEETVITRFNVEPEAEAEAEVRYHWMDNETGELRENLWKVIAGDIQDAIWCIKTRRKLFRRKWKYSKKGW